MNEYDHEKKNTDNSINKKISDNDESDLIINTVSFSSNNESVKENENAISPKSKNTIQKNKNELETEKGKEIPKIKEKLFTEEIITNINSNKIYQEINQNKYFEDQDKYRSKKIEIILMLLSCILIILLVIYYILSNFIEKIKILYTNDYFVKPLADYYNYEIIKLTNGLEVILIQNYSISQCSGTLFLNSGVNSPISSSYSQGIAHLTEHLMLIGNDKYSHTEIANHFAKYDGFIKGQSSEFSTVFSFEVSKEAFRKSLDIFSSLIRKPVFTYSDIKGEIDNVHDEYLKSLTDIESREWHLLINFILNEYTNKDNEILPQGNNETFDKDFGVIKNQIIEYKNYAYNAKNMKLAILGNENLLKMRELVTKYFQYIPKDDETNNKNNNYDLKTQKLNENINKNFECFKEKNEQITVNSGKIFAIKSTTSANYINIYYFIQITNSKKKSISVLKNYIKYLQYLLRSTDEGSLFRELNTNHNVNRINTNTAVLYSNIIQLQITLNIPNYSLKDLPIILKKVYNYIKIVRKSKVSQLKYFEVQKIFNKTLLFNEQLNSPSRITNNLAGKVSSNPSVKYMFYDKYLPDLEFDEMSFREIYANLIPENSVIVLGIGDAEKFASVNLSEFISDEKTEKTFKLFPNETKYFDIHYGFANLNNLINLREMSDYDNLFKISEKENKYITNLNKLVYPKSKDESDIKVIPDIMMGDRLKTHFTIYHKTDRSFNIPKVIMYVNVLHPMSRSNNTDDHINYLLYYYSIYDNLNIIFSDAMSGGNKIEMSNHINGFNINMTVYSDLIKKVNKKFWELIFKKNLVNNNTFDMYLGRVYDEISSYQDLQPYVKSGQYFKEIIMKNLTDLYNIKIHNYSDAARQIMIDRVNNYIDDMVITVLYYGDIDRITIGDIIEENDLTNKLNESRLVIENIFNNFPRYNIWKNFLIPAKRLTPYSIFYTPNKYIPQICTSNYFYIGKLNLRNDILTNILVLIFENKFYDELRTKRHIGSIVKASRFIYSNEIYMNFLIQFPETNTEYNESTINYELDKVIKDIIKPSVYNITKEELYNLRETVLIEHTAKDQTLQQRCDKVNNFLMNFYNTMEKDDGVNNYYFMDKIKRKDVINSCRDPSILKTYFNVNFNSSHHKMSIQIYYDKEGTIKTREKEISYLNSRYSAIPQSDIHFLK